MLNASEKTVKMSFWDFVVSRFSGESARTRRLGKRDTRGQRCTNSSAAHPHIPSCSIASCPTISTLALVSLHLHHLDSRRVSPSLPKPRPQLNSCPKRWQGWDKTVSASVLQGTLGTPEQVFAFNSPLCTKGKGLPGTGR